MAVIKSVSKTEKSTVPSKLLPLANGAKRLCIIKLSADGKHIDAQFTVAEKGKLKSKSKLCYPVWVRFDISKLSDLIRARIIASACRIMYQTMWRASPDKFNAAKWSNGTTRDVQTMFTMPRKNAAPRVNPLSPEAIKTYSAEYKAELIALLSAA